MHNRGNYPIHTATYPASDNDHWIWGPCNKAASAIEARTRHFSTTLWRNNSQWDYPSTTPSHSLTILLGLWWETWIYPYGLSAWNKTIRERGTWKHLELVQENNALCSTGVCLVLAAGSEIQANLRFNIFSFLPFLAFTRGVPWVHFWLPPIKWG